MALISPRSAGLFAKGIIESGPCLTPLPTLAAAEASGINFGDEVRCSDQSAACLRALAVDAVLNPVIAQNDPVTGGTIWTDYGFSCPSRAMTRMLAPLMPVFAYEFDDSAAPAPFVDADMPMGAYHTAELLYVFQSDVTAIAPLRSTVSQLNPAQRALSDQMIRYWGRFAASGDPNGAGDPAWPGAASGDDVDLLLAPGATASRAGFYRNHKCTFWAGPYP